jgi:16S rRNA (adenine1518-N6/adenine1519-N6)-dimethyltransferase
MSDALAEDGLPPLRAVIDQYGLAAKKSLGQNFLFDLNLTRKIARAAQPLNEGTVVEVGPGPGGLTRALLAESVQDLLVVERDPRALPALEEISAHYPGRMRIVVGDALEQDWPSLVKGRPRVVSNLPYNVGTLLLTGWLTSPSPFVSYTLMFQKEVAERIVAAPNSSAYGRLSVLCQYMCEARKLFDVNRAAFTPPPKITSSIVQLTPRIARELDCEIGSLERVTASGFGQRRKMLRSSLRGAFAAPEEILRELSINPELRAENLAVKDFVRLAIKAQSSSRAQNP